MAFKKNHKSGFTLVELAIVMTIIGLLIGGILKGQELMNNARVTATIAQIKGYDAAITTFRDKYEALPGDMQLPSKKLPGCGASLCDVPTEPAAQSGNGIVGLTAWGAGGYLQQAPSTGTMAVFGTNERDETVYFWMHLLQAGLISGVTPNMINVVASTPPAWGDTHPAAKIGGGFVVGDGDGTKAPGAPAGTTEPTGMLLVLTPRPNAALNATSGAQVLSPTRAAQIDRKMDDGMPASGSVRAYGLGTSCLSTATPFSATAPGYLESISNSDCGLMIGIQG